MLCIGPSAPVRAAAAHLVFLAALGAALLGADPAEAKGKRGGGSSSSSSASHSSSSGSGKSSDSGGGGGITINLRSGGNGSNSGAGTGTANNFVPIGPSGAGGAPSTPSTAAPGAPDPEEAARRAAFMERQANEKAAAERAAAEKAEADRLAAEKLEAERAVQRAAREKAEAAKLAADNEKRRREEAAVNSDVDRVLQRAKEDYPVLRTAEGQVLLQRILDRQKVLMARGLYPSVAMVEAVADHREQLTPRVKAAVVEPESAPAAAPSTAYGACRWVTPTQWACNK